MTTWVESTDLLDWIKYYFGSDLRCTNVELLTDSRPVVWNGLSQGSGRLSTVATPIEFFINAQCGPGQNIDCLVDQICNTLSDICAAQQQGFGTVQSSHFITLRSPHQVLKAPTGAIQLTILASVYTEAKGRDLYIE